MDELDSGGGQSGGDNNKKAGLDADNDDGTTPIPDRV